MPIGYVVLSGVLALGVLGLGFYVLITTRYRDAEPAWREVATSLGGEVIRATTSLNLVAVVDGRPIKVETIQRGRGRKARTFTLVAAALRHPDDILAGAPPPGSSAQAWMDAWRRAAKGEAEDQSDDRRLPTSPTGTRHIEGILSSATALKSAITTHLETIRSREERVLAWRAAGDELGLDSSTAYVLRGRWNDRGVVIGGDVLDRTVTVRAATATERRHDGLVIGGNKLEGVHHLDRIDDVGLPEPFELHGEDPDRTLARCRAVLPLVAELGDAIIRADEHGATVTFDVLTPDVTRWRHALDIVTRLA